MMKKFAKALGLALALTLILSMVACNQQTSIVGTWKSSVNLGSVLAESQDNPMGNSFTEAVKDLSIAMELDLREDNSYSFKIDEASVKQAVNDMKTKISENLPSIMAELAGVSEEELKTIMTEEDMLKSFNQAFDADEMAEKLVVLNLEGSYRFEDGKLYLTEKDQEEKADDYMTVELKGKEMKITAVSGDNEDVKSFESMLPMSFTR